MLPYQASAVQWRLLNGTSRYSVSYDEQSIRLTPVGRLEVWLRFVPRNDTERKTAAAEFKDKRYRSHLEYYEIDCSDQTAQLGLIDLFGASRVRINRLKGSAQPEQIISGSVLDNLVQDVCPVLDEEATTPPDDDGQDTPETGVQGSRPPLNSEKQALIDRLKRMTEANASSADMWKELGNAYFDTDQVELAIAAYDRALALKPEDTDILNDQGAMFRQHGDFQRALKNFEKAFSINPQNLESLYNSAYVYAFDQNDAPKAQVLWQRYLALDATSETAQQVRGFIAQTTKPAPNSQEK
jgi:tetratricopeptide (TPR) repeat protein